MNPSSRRRWLVALSGGIIVFALGLWLRNHQLADPASRSEPATGTQAEGSRSSTDPPSPDTSAADSAPGPLDSSPSREPGAVSAELPPGEEDRDRLGAARESDALGESAPRWSEQESTRWGEGRLALVIDDLGRDVRDVERFGAIAPMTFAVLPFERRTEQVVAALESAGAGFLCHLPMEGASGADPGPGALLLGMSAEELREKTQAALLAVPGAMGVNNHMGSALTADQDAMQVVLDVVRQHDLFFLDSRTGADTVGFKLAREQGLPAAERHVFLDGERDEEAIRERFWQAVSIARSRGFAVAIGHPYGETLYVLRSEVPRARELGIEPVGLLELVE